MPWTPDDAARHTHKVTTCALKELWAKVATECLERTGDEGRAIREANAVIARQAEGTYTRSPGESVGSVWRRNRIAAPQRSFSQQRRIQWTRSLMAPGGSICL